jgi:hypothetical protein
MDHPIIEDDAYVSLDYILAAEADLTTVTCMFAQAKA